MAGMADDAKCCGRNRNSHILPGEMKTRTATSENRTAAPYQVKCRLSKWPSNLTSRYLPKTKNKAQVDTKTISLMHNTPKLERIQMPSTGDLITITAVCLFDTVLLRNENEGSQGAGSPNGWLSLALNGTLLS